MDDKKPAKVLFVCLGNICRSPVAHAVFEHLLQQINLQDIIKADSAGTAAYHAGEKADSRMRATALEHGVDITHIARQFRRSDFDSFDLILAMDSQNMRDILKIAVNDEQRSKVKLFRTYDPQAGSNMDVPDPYYGGAEGFENVFVIVERTGKVLLDSLMLK
jgi:protein-tyrosine phosphatase